MDCKDQLKHHRRNQPICQVDYLGTGTLCFERGFLIVRLPFTSITKTIATNFLFKRLVFLVKKCVKFVLDEQHTEGHYQLLA